MSYISGSSNTDPKSEQAYSRRSFVPGQSSKGQDIGSLLAGFSPANSSGQQIAGQNIPSGNSSGGQSDLNTLFGSQGDLSSAQRNGLFNGLINYLKDSSGKRGKEQQTSYKTDENGKTNRNNRKRKKYRRNGKADYGNKQKLGGRGNKEQSKADYQTKPYEEKFLAEINALRAKKGLKPLKLNLDLKNVAIKHLKELYRYGDRVAHSGLGEWAQGRFKGSGYDGTPLPNKENVARLGTTSPVRGWLQSSGHLKNMLAKGADEVGIARIRAKNGDWYYVMEMGRSANA